MNRGIDEGGAVGRCHPKRLEPSDMDPDEKGFLRALKPREEGLKKPSPMKPKPQGMFNLLSIMAIIILTTLILSS